MSTRREFITLLGGAAAASSRVAYSQPNGMRRIGVLLAGPNHPEVHSRLLAFQQTLQQLGWVEGRNVHFDIRWVAGNTEDVTTLARKLVELRPDVILTGPTSILLPLRNQTRSIPIVFVGVSDPLGQGIVESLARPTGNVTGFSNLEFSLIGKWLQILKEIAPATSRVAVPIYTENAVSATWYRMFNAVAPSFAIEPIPTPIITRADIESAIVSIARAPNGGLIVPGDTLVENPVNRRMIVELAASHRLPAMYTNPAFVSDGGLMSYGIDQTDPYRRAADYVDRILKGEKPADLPVQQPTKFEFILNLKAAKALGLAVPVTLQASADEVIE